MNELTLTLRATQTYERGQGGTVHVRFANNVGKVMSGNDQLGEVSSLIGGGVEIVREGRHYTIDALEIWRAFTEAASAMDAPALAVGDVIAIGHRRVRVAGMPDGVTVCRDHRGRIAVRNVDTNRLSYVPQVRLTRTR